MDIKPIKSEGDFEKALQRVESLWNAPQGSAESDELDMLATLIEAYERDHYPVGLPDPVEAIRFRLEQQGKDSRALIGVIGQLTWVYEVLRGKRSLSLNMIPELHDKLGIPANVLIQPGRKSRKRELEPARFKTRSNAAPRSARRLSIATRLKFKIASALYRYFLNSPQWSLLGYSKIGNTNSSKCCVCRFIRTTCEPLLGETMAGFMSRIPFP